MLDIKKSLRLLQRGGQSASTEQLLKGISNEFTNQHSELHSARGFLVQAIGNTHIGEEDENYNNDENVSRRPETLLTANNQMITTENVILLHKQNSQTKVIYHLYHLICRCKA